jgi:hypothetical protein
MTVRFDLDPLIARYTVVAFDDSTALGEAGIDSSSLLRLAVEVADDDGAEIDAARLVSLGTIGELKRWLGELAGAGTEPEKAPC